MAPRRVIVPQGIEFQNWASSQSFVRPELNWPRPLPVDEWWYWGACIHFISSPDFPNIPYPSKSLYPSKDDWQKWAAQTVYALI